MHTQVRRDLIVKYKKSQLLLPVYTCVTLKMKVTQLYPILCDPMDYGFIEFLQARILEWVAFPFCMGSSQPRDQTQVSCIIGGFFTIWATREPSGSQFYTHLNSLKNYQGSFFSFFFNFNTEGELYANQVKILGCEVRYQYLSKTSQLLMCMEIT